MKFERIVHYFDYLRGKDDEVEFTEEQITNAFEEIGISEFESVEDIPTRLVENLFTTLIGVNRAKRMDPNQEQDILDLFEDIAVNGRVDVPTFVKLVRYLLRKDISQKNALIVVDVQNDFISGSLALKNSPAQQDGEEVVPVINDIISANEFDEIVYSKDWHPENHASFYTNVGLYELHESSPVKSADDAKPFETVIYNEFPHVSQTLWPPHCVQGTEGAELHPDLTVVDGSIILNKGFNPKVDSYSTFWDNSKLSRTWLIFDLMDRNITTLFITGLAIDYCVAYSAIDAYNHGFVTYLVKDACRGITELSIDEMKVKCSKMGITYIESSSIPKLLGSS